MDLVPESSKKKPGYPTLDEYARDRRRYLRQLAEVAGALAIAGVGVVCAKKPPSTRLAGLAMPVREPDTLQKKPDQDTVRPKIPGSMRAPEPEPLRLGGKPQPPKPPVPPVRKRGIMPRPKNGADLLQYCPGAGDSTKSKQCGDSAGSVKDTLNPAKPECSKTK